MKRKGWLYLVVLMVLCALVLPGLLSTPAHAQTVLYVTENGISATCTGDWSNACVLQVAIGQAVAGDEIWVAEGTYVPSVTLPEPRGFSFTLNPGVKWFGGFPPEGGTWEERDWEANPTILSGDIGISGDESDNLYHVVRSTGVDASAVLDGFTITGGKADVAPDYVSGAGMYNVASSPTIRHVIFEWNNASQYGGGMCNLAGSEPTLEDVTFRNNTGSWGGGIASLDSAHPVVNDSSFANNSAIWGGAIYNLASVDLNSSTITGNRAQVSGGGVSSLFSVTGGMSISGSTITGNIAIEGNGGGVYTGGVMTIEDSTISGNEASAGFGGGIYSSGGHDYDLILNDSVMEGNSSELGGAICSHASLFVNRCILGGNQATFSGGAIHNAGPLTIDSSTLVANASGGQGGAISSQTGSVSSIVNSTLSGNQAAIAGGGIWQHDASINLHNVTLTDNVADADETDSGDEEVGDDGGGLFNWNGEVTIENSIIAGNLDRSPAGDVHPDCTTHGSPSFPTPMYNLIGDTTGCDGVFTDASNDVGDSAAPVDPKLGRLADNGGTPTHGLLTESPARDAGDPNGCQAPAGSVLFFDQRGVSRHRDGDGDGIERCDMGAFEAGPGNDVWHRALTLDLSSSSALVYEYVDQLGQSRWYKFQVAPGSRVTAEMFPPNANLDIALFGDIQAAYDELLAPEEESDLVRLNAEFAADAYSPFAYSPFAYSPFAYSPFAYSPFAYSPFAYSPFAYSPFAYSPFAYSPFAYSPFAYSPFAYSPFAYSPFAYSPFAYSPFAYSPFDYLPDPAYTSAQMQTLMAISAFDGTASELIEVNTWDNRGEFYLRVSGRNGAFDVLDPFMLQVTQDEDICLGVDLISRPAPPTAPPGDLRALFLTDWGRLGATYADWGDLQTALAPFAAGVGGTVVDVGLDTYVADANAAADAKPQCPYAKNQVAWLIKDIVTAYRDAGNPLEYVVLVGGDDVIPYFRYRDRAELGCEKDYKPPVIEGTSSYASLTLGYVLSQDAYGSTLDLALNNTTLPIPDLAVGRLVETPADIIHMLGVYPAADGGVVVPGSALVTGYDFLEDAANAIRSELETGLGGAGVEALITPDEISPQDREGEPPFDAPWSADMLADLLLGPRHDLIFLAGHFTAQGALAADYETRLWASDLVASPVDLENALVYSAGCHSGYNIVNDHGIPYVTAEPDWAQAFAQKGATFIGGTGYQYGDTDFLEYSERLYLEFTRELRCGAQPRSVGQALVEAKQAYLAGTAQMRGIHEKAFLEATLFGLPMLQVDGLSDAGCPVDPGSIVGATGSYTSDPATPGEILGLQYADVTVTSNLTLHTVPLRNVVDPGIYMDATYFSGTDGTVTGPAEPVLPLERRNVHVPGYVLRGAGFRGGRFADLPGHISLTGAASTETRAAHTPFQSDVLYPLHPWSVNYFDLLADPASGITWLDVTPAQFVSDADGNIWTGTWRRFDDMEFRLFYSNHTATLNAGAVPSLAAPPAILQVLATSGTDEVHFQVTVAGDLAAGIQEVWVTYTGIPCTGGACWQSLDLAQNADDSTLWEGTLSLNGTSPGEIRYVAQAVNGVGLVSLVTNQGEHYRVDVDPADPAAGGDPASPLESTTVEFQSPPTSGAYSTEATFSAVLQTSGGTPIEGQRVAFALGAQQRSVVTDSSGGATVAFPLHGAPGDYDVNATFAGSTGYQRSSTASPFTILKQGTQLSFLQDPGLAQYSDDAHMTAELTDADGNTLGEMTVLFVVSGGGQSYVVAEITDLTGQASPSRLPLPAGTYDVEASFGQVVTVNGATIDLTDANYNGSHATGTLDVLPEDAAVTYTGDTTVPEASTTLNLEAEVRQADDGAPGDLSLAWVQYDVWDGFGNWVTNHQDRADSDGMSTATLVDLDPGSYQVGVTVYGGYFLSSPAPQVAGVSLPLEPVQVNTTVYGSAYFIDPDSPLGHTAVWAWGDGTTCDTNVHSECGLIEPAGSTPGEVMGYHTYTQPGVYTVRLTVTDGDEYAAETVYEFVVVYDLTSGKGFVTGGGWIWSVPGWCQLDDPCAAAEGKANFGFVSRYKKGASQPTGYTEFQFKAGGLNFHSDSYDWLVVNQAGTNAQFKGVGTINGADAPNGELYKFMLWAGDGDPDGDDTFRIRVWWEDEADESEIVVYDNGFDQAINGGSIVIHRDK